MSFLCTFQPVFIQTDFHRKWFSTSTTLAWFHALICRFRLLGPPTSSWIPVKFPIDDATWNIEMSSIWDFLHSNQLTIRTFIFVYFVWNGSREFIVKPYFLLRLTTAVSVMFVQHFVGQIHVFNILCFQPQFFLFWWIYPRNFPLNIRCHQTAKWDGKNWARWRVNFGFRGNSIRLWCMQGNLEYLSHFVKKSKNMQNRNKK